jgi:2'-5' RNA ligase
LDALERIIVAEAAGHPAFEIGAGGLGAFPSTKKPRIVWVAVQAPAELITLQRAIDHATARLGYPSENRPFSPHLTIGRVSRNANNDDLRRLNTALLNTRSGFVEGAKVQDVHLYRSDLQPGGAVYTSLCSANLAAR